MNIDCTSIMHTYVFSLSFCLRQTSAFFFFKEEKERKLHSLSASVTIKGFRGYIPRKIICHFQQQVAPAIYKGLHNRGLLLCHRSRSLKVSSPGWMQRSARSMRLGAFCLPATFLLKGVSWRRLRGRRRVGRRTPGLSAALLGRKILPRSPSRDLVFHLRGEQGDVSQTVPRQTGEDHHGWPIT